MLLLLLLMLLLLLRLLLLLLLRSIDDIDIEINQGIIESVHYFKYLGVVFDGNLNVAEHIKNLQNKACSKLGVICKAHYCVGHSTALTFY